MAFQQFKLSRVVNQTRGIFDKYIYKPDNGDTIADVITAGYFDESRYIDSPDWVGSVIEVNASDGYAVIQIGESSTTSLYDSSVINGLVDVNGQKPVHYLSLTNKVQSVVGDSKTWCYMFMVPVEFSSVRLCYNHLGGSGAAVGLKALVAPSDDIGDLSYANTVEGKHYSTPWEGGVEVNTVSARGWNQVTWGGVDVIGAADAGADKIETVWSDVIECQSRALTDNQAGRFEGYYPVIVRIMEGTGGFTRSSMSGFNADDFLTGCGPRAIQGGFKFVDAVTDPSTWDNSDGINIGNATVPAIALEFLTADRASKSIMTVGDSRMAIAAPSQVATKEYNCMQWLIEQKAIAGGDKYSVLPASQSGLSTRKYSDRAMEIMANGNLQSNFSLYLAYSINSGLPTRIIIDEAKFLLLRHVDRCKELGITPVIMDAFPYSTGYTVDQLSLINEVVQLISNLGLSTISPLLIYGDASGGWLPGTNEDSDHGTPETYADLAGRSYQLIKSI